MQNGAQGIICMHDDDKSNFNRIIRVCGGEGGGEGGGPDYGNLRCVVGPSLIRLMMVVALLSYFRQSRLLGMASWPSPGAMTAS